MYCKKCGEKFYIQRNFLTLFSEKKEYLCERCYKKYPIQLNVEKIQLEKYQCSILSMFSKKYFIDYNYFVKEYNQIFKRYLNRPDVFLLFMDVVELEEQTIMTIDTISRLVEQDVFILTFYLKK